MLQVMRGYFSSILALAQCLLRSPDPCVVPVGGHMYRHSFTAFDSYCQQVGLGFFSYFLLCFHLFHLVVCYQDLSSKNP